MRILFSVLFLFSIKPICVTSQCEWQYTGNISWHYSWEHTQFDGNIYTYCYNDAYDINHIVSDNWTYFFDSELTNDCFHQDLYAFNDTLLSILPIDPFNNNSNNQLRYSLIDASDGSLIGYQDVGGRLGCFDRTSRYQFGTISIGNNTFVRGYNVFEDNLIQYPISLEIGWDKLVDVTFDGTFFYFLIQIQGSGASVYKCNLDGEVILQSAPLDGGVNIQIGQIYYVPESTNGEIRVVSDGGSYYSLLKSNLEFIGVNNAYLLGYTSNQGFQDVDVVIANHFLYRLTVNEIYVNSLNGGYTSINTGAYLRKYDYDSLILLDSCSINSDPNPQQHLDLVNEESVGLRVSGANGGSNHSAFILIPQLGCTDQSASNFDPSASSDDGSCEYLNYDGNGDGCVDVNDMLDLLLEYGQCEPETQLDFDGNGDGCVNGEDVLNILVEYGSCE